MTNGNNSKKEMYCYVDSDGPEKDKEELIWG